MTYKWVIALSASTCLAAASVSQETSQNSSDVLAPVIEESENLAQDVVEPEIEVPEIADEPIPLSIADYEASQTGIVVDAIVAAEAMAKAPSKDSTVLSPSDALLEDTVFSAELNSIAMDSDEVAAAEGIEADDIIHGNEELGEEVTALFEDDITHSDGLSEEQEEFAELTSLETEEAEEPSQDDAEMAPIPASDAVSEVLEQAGIEIADE